MFISYTEISIVLVFITRRLLLLIPVILGVLTLIFLMRALVPGDPIEIMFLGQMPPDPETVANIRRELGLDKPLPLQYVEYIAGVLQGDLGTSIRTRRPVLEEIRDRYPYTLILTTASLIVALFVGLGTGIVAAVYRDSWIDTGTMLLALFGLSMPAFWFGLIMIQIFAVQLRWFPVMGSSSWRHLVLPALTLGLIAATVQARIARSSMLEVLSSDYIRTAKAKGLFQAHRGSAPRAEKRPDSDDDHSRSASRRICLVGPSSSSRSLPGTGWASWLCRRFRSAISPWCRVSSSWWPRPMFWSTC